MADRLYTSYNLIWYAVYFSLFQFTFCIVCPCPLKNEWNECKINRSYGQNGKDMLIFMRYTQKKKGAETAPLGVLFGCL